MRPHRCHRLTCAPRSWSSTALVLALCLAGASSAQAAAAPGPAIAFSNGVGGNDRPPVDALGVFAEVVIPAARLNDGEVATLKSRGVSVIARLGPSDLAGARGEAGEKLLS